MAIEVIRPNQQAAARMFVRLLQRHPVKPEDAAIVDYLRIASEGAICYDFYLQMRSRCQFLQDGNDLVTCAVRAVCTNYTRAYLERGCRIAVALAGNKGEGRSQRELRTQRRDLLECFCR